MFYELPFDMVIANNRYFKLILSFIHGIFFSSYIMYIYVCFQVKELGAALYNCSCAGMDLYKIFKVNWDVAHEGAVIPPEWPIEYKTKINKGENNWISHDLNSWQRSVSLVVALTLYEDRSFDVKPIFSIYKNFLKSSYWHFNSWLRVFFHCICI